MAQNKPDQAPNLAQPSSPPPPQQSPPPGATGLVSYKFKYHRFKGYYEFISLQPPRTIHVQVRSLTLRRPNVTLHDGPSASHPVLGVAHISSLSSKIDVGLGSYNHRHHRRRWRHSESKEMAGTGNVSWETMTMSGSLSAVHTWNLPADDGTGRPRTGPFRWKEDHEWTYCQYVLLDAAGRELARYARNRGLRSGGALIVHESLGKDFETMVMLTLVAIYLKRKDSDAFAASAGAWASAGGAVAYA